MPTNIAFRPDSTDFYVADGYGAWVIHVYDRDANYKSTFGKPGPGKEDGQFDTPHGIWIDRREGREPAVVVADRANGRLQWFTLDGKHRETLDGFMFPANVDTFGELMLVPELQARVTLLDGKNKVVARFGNDAAWGTESNEKGNPQGPGAMARWQIHPPARRLLRRARQHLRVRMGGDRTDFEAAESELGRLSHAA